MSRVVAEGAGALVELEYVEMVIMRHHVEEALSAVSPDVDLAAGHYAATLEALSSVDPFDDLAQSMSPVDEDDEERDAFSRRLFPDAYVDDPRASRDFRRFTEHDLRRDKLIDGLTVLIDLDAAIRALRHLAGDHEPDPDVDGTIAISAAGIDPWVKTLATTRLFMAVALNISTADDLDELEQLPETDPRGFQVAVFEWLGAIEQQLLEVVLPDA